MTVVVIGPNIISKLGPKISEDFFKALEKEGIIFDSGKIWLTFRASNLKGKGVYVGSHISLRRGRFVYTQKRLVATVSNRKIIDVPKESQFFEKIIINKNNPKRYKIEVNLNDFPTGFRGNISVEYHINLEKIII